MISETQFAGSYSSVWRELLPNSEAVITTLNKTLRSIGKSARNFSRPNRRAFLNEIGFQLFLSAPNFSGSYITGSHLLEPAVGSARIQQARYTAEQAGNIPFPDTIEQFEVESIYRSLLAFRGLMPITFDIVPRPAFVGCGLLDSCSGDFLLGNTLVEVKSGDRNFRSVDVRQVLTYCALNYARPEYNIESVSCVNPRRGIYFITEIETLCLQLAAKSSNELLSELIYFVSSGDVSR